MDSGTDVLMKQVSVCKYLSAYKILSIFIVCLKFFHNKILGGNIRRSTLILLSIDLIQIDFANVLIVSFTRKSQIMPCKLFKCILFSLFL